MGQSHSTERVAATRYSLQGWPAFLWHDELRQQMRSFRMTKSLLGRRVRLFDSRGTCIEYALVPHKSSRRLYQRVDAPCMSRAGTSRLPLALPRTSFQSGYKHMGLLTHTKDGDTRVEVQHPPSGECASYGLTESGIWLKMKGGCPELEHRRVIRKQVARLKKDERGAKA